MTDGDILCPLSQLAETDSERVCALQGSRTFSFQEMHGLAGGVQAWCAEQGLQSGDRLGVGLPPGPLWIPFLFGCLRESILFTPLNLRQPGSVQSALLEAVGAVQVIREVPALNAICKPQPRLKPACPATLVFTSGSSGTAKARVHSLANHLASSEGSQERDGLGPGDRWLQSLPLYHVGGLAVLFRCVFAGVAVYFPEESEPVEEVLFKGLVSHASLVPTQLLRLLERSPECPPDSPVKRLLIGGAAAGEELLQRAFSGGWPVAACYGSTETGSQVVSVPAGVSPEGAGYSSGICLPHAALKCSEQGELLVKSDSLCLGSWEQGKLVPITDEHGWYHTGDAGRISEEGWVHVEGRMDRMMISGGENLHPEHIEAALRRVTGREQVVVVPVPDPEFGHRPGAWVEGTVTAGEEARWREQLRKWLPGYMIPVGIRSLPETSGLKPDLRWLRESW